MKTFALMALMASVQACGVEDSANEYNYDDIGDNWQVEGFHSPVCLEGREQSPIDLPSDGGISDDLLNFVISEHQNYTEEDDLVNTRKTHTIEIGLQSGALDITFPDADEQRFSAAQFHAHAPSEHTVDGEFRDLEIHFVHVHPDGDRFAVIGVFFDVDENAEPNAFIDQLGYEDADMGENDIGALDVAAFLEGINTENYWHYDGSFTTPPCTEGVEWFVMKEVQPITQEQLESFQQYNWGNADYENGEGNNRRTQPLYERTLYNIDATAADDGEAAGEDGAAEEGEAAGEDGAAEEGEAAGEEETAESADDEAKNGNNVDISIDFNVNVGQHNADE